MKQTKDGASIQEDYFLADFNSENTNESSENGSCAFLGLLNPSSPMTEE